MNIKNTDGFVEFRKRVMLWMRTLCVKDFQFNFVPEKYEGIWVQIKPRFGLICTVTGFFLALVFGRIRIRLSLNPHPVPVQKI